MAQRLELEATMRDGTVLRADVYRPEGVGPWPVLLARTPYGRSDADMLGHLDPLHCAGRGFLVVIQDCRGRFGSEGDWVPLVHEREDGYGTVEWAAGLEGSDGRVVMYGPSYLGCTQRAAIAARPPQLVAAAPGFTWSDPDNGLVSRGGAYELGAFTQWTLTVGVNVLERAASDRLGELNRAIAHLATRTYWELPADAPIRRFGLPLPTLDSPTFGPSTVPVIIATGWYDCFLQGSLDNFIKARSAGVPATLIIGPWSHDNYSSRVGEVDFGETADAGAIDHAGSLLDRELDWLDRQLRSSRTDRGAAGPATAEPEQSVLVFVMGANTWRRIPTWPPAATETPWFLHEGGGLSPDMPEPEAAPDAFRSDPANPVMTHGGAVLLTPDFPNGPFDQAKVEERDDVRVYSSAPLSTPLEIMGRIRVHLNGESTAPVTDWVARLCDVDADGVSRNIADGVLRSHQADVQEHVIDLWSTAHTFLPGHRIHLQVAGSCFPRWDRVTAARQTIYHDSTRPSRLILPVTDAEGCGSV